MSKIKILCIFLVTVFATVILTENTAAQANRRKHVGGKGHVVVVHKRVYHPRVARRAHIRYAAMPRWGAVVAVAPAGAIIIRHHNTPYHFYNGIFYTPRNNAFVVVRPARGIRIRVLPAGYRTIVVGSRNYYYYYGAFYAKANNSEEYDVVDAPEGAIVDALPDGYEVKTINGQEYYTLDNVYYAEVDDKNMEDGVGYIVVKI